VGGGPESGGAKNVWGGGNLRQGRVAGGGTMVQGKGVERREGIRNWDETVPIPLRLF